MQIIARELDAEPDHLARSLVLVKQLEPHKQPKITHKEADERYIGLKGRLKQLRKRIDEQTAGTLRLICSYTLTSHLQARRSRCRLLQKSTPALTRP